MPLLGMGRSAARRRKAAAESVNKGTVFEPLVTPMLASAALSLSSVSVGANSLILGSVRL